MAAYEVLKESFIDDVYYMPGARLEKYSGWPGTGLKPLDAEAKKTAERWEELKTQKAKNPDMKLPRSPAEDKGEPAGEDKKSGKAK